MKTTLKKWGNSQGIRLPKYVLETMGWSEDEALEVLADGDKLIIKKANKLKTIDEFFDLPCYDYEYLLDYPVSVCPSASIRLVLLQANDERE